jgi:phosphoribosyl 1,2-cyclic phosphodiesterase
MLTATFYGVRGSTPCSCDGTRGIGGNTSCVLVAVDDADPIVLDLGTGARYLGHDLVAGRHSVDQHSVDQHSVDQRSVDQHSVDQHSVDQHSVDQHSVDRPFRATALITHLHWDHIQGAPFFKPLLTAGAELEMVGPCQPGSSLEAEITQFVRPPAFPVSLAQMPGRVSFRDATNERFAVGPVAVTVFDVPHVGPTNGYRLDGGGGSIAYVSDHQQPCDGSLHVPDSIVEACLDVDILVHDAQFDANEFAQRSDWGHCTPEFALALAHRCRARRLVLFHHDPAHHDEWVNDTVVRIQAEAATGLEVIGAFEGLRLHSGASQPGSP